MSEREGGRKSKEKRTGGMREGEEACAIGASFQVSNTTSGDGFKPNSPINTRAKREYIKCLTIAHFEKDGTEQKGE